MGAVPTRHGASALANHPLHLHRRDPRPVRLRIPRWVQLGRDAAHVRSARETLDEAFDLDHRPDDPGNPVVDFRGEKRSNETHQSRTDPESELARKAPGQPSRLAFSGHALMESRNGLLVDLLIARGN